MSISEDLSDTFSIFHDGCFESWTGDRRFVRIKIACQYLAELIDPSYEAFFLDLVDITHLELSPWWKDPENKTVLTDLKTIFDMDLDILEGNIKGEWVEVICNHDGDDCAGGNLLIGCAEFAVYDEHMNPLTIDRLKNISEQHWTNFGKR